MNKHLEAADALPAKVIRMVEFANNTQPDVIVSVDRDARPIGYAFDQIRRSIGSEALKSTPFHFKRISKRLTLASVQEHCVDVLDILQAIEGPRIMVIDDFVSSRAGTMHMFRKICQNRNINPQIDWVTMTGKGTALNILPYASPANEIPWRDRPDIMGIDYDGVTLLDRTTPDSVAFYARIDEAVQRVIA